MPRRLVLLSLFAVSACQFLPAATTPAGLAPTTETPKGSAGEPGVFPDASIANDADPLRDPRERRLRHVRQLTRSRLVAMPQFSADGRFLYVAEERATPSGPKQIVLLRVSLADPQKPTEEVTPTPSGAVWGLTPGKGGPCVIATSSPCADETWPTPAALLDCEGLTTVAPTGDPAQTCPPVRGSLPCAVASSGTALGNEVCPVQADELVHLAFSKAGATSPLPLGPATGNSWMPALSRDGSRLIFVSEPDEKRARLLVSFLDHVDPQPAPIGPEASQTMDPTFTPPGDRVLFASTADDAAGHEVDLMLVSVIGGALERVTFAPGIDRYPTFSPDGRQLAWISERNADARAQDLYVADWVAEP